MDNQAGAQGRAHRATGAKALWLGLVADPKHGPLPVLLLGLTVVSGVVDAVSILGLGRVFVANMTGNVVFVGLGIVGAPGFSLAASFIALAGFLFGALVGGLTMDRLGGTRGLLLRNVAVVEVVLFVVAFCISLAVATPFSSANKGRYCRRQCYRARAAKLSRAPARSTGSDNYGVNHDSYGHSR